MHRCSVTFGEGLSCDGSLGDFASKFAEVCRMNDPSVTRQGGVTAVE